MRQITRTILSLSLLLGGAALSGCGDRATDDPAPTSASDQQLTEQVELVPAVERLEEGQVVSHQRTRQDGSEITHRYEKRNGELVPLDGGPALEATDHELDVIPVTYGDGTGGPVLPPRTVMDQDAEAAEVDWVVDDRQVEVPPITVDRSYRIATDTFVAKLREDGRSVEARQRDRAGASRAQEVTRVAVDGTGLAMVYQFDDPQTLEMWYRVTYQLHHSAGQDPDDHIRIEGMTMIRVTDKTDAAVLEQFRSTERLPIQR